MVQPQSPTWHGPARLLHKRATHLAGVHSTRRRLFRSSAEGVYTLSVAPGMSSHTAFAALRPCLEPAAAGDAERLPVKPAAAGRFGDSDLPRRGSAAADGPGSACAERCQRHRHASSSAKATCMCMLMLYISGPKSTHNNQQHHNAKLSGRGFKRSSEPPPGLWDRAESPPSADHTH